MVVELHNNSTIWQLSPMHVGLLDTVYRGINKHTKEQVAVKVFPLKNETVKQAFISEVKISKELSGLDHFPIVVDSFCKNNKGYLITQLLPMDLFTLSQYRLSEGAIKKIFYQLCSAVSTMHSKNIAHLDIKPENILLDESGYVVLCDFGHSLYFNHDIQILLEGGTQIYRAPEVNRCELSQPQLVDTWSLGIVLHMLITGTFPYQGNSGQELKENVDRDNINFTALRNSVVSVDLKHLVWCILKPNPVKRIPLRRIFKHCWMKDCKEVVPGNCNK